MKKRNLTPLIVITAVALAAAFAIFTGSGSQKTGFAAGRFISCQDNDSAQIGFEAGSEFMKGSVMSQDQYGGMLLSVDRCYRSDLLEFFCRKNNAPGMRRVNCEFGCDSGACRSESQSAHTCADSDGGQDFFTQGTANEVLVNDRGVMVRNNSQKDHCGAGAYRNRVREFYCDGDQMRSNSTRCEFGCYNGACRESPRLPADLVVSSFERVNEAGRKLKIEVCNIGESGIDKPAFGVTVLYFSSSDRAVTSFLDAQEFRIEVLRAGACRIIRPFMPRAVLQSGSQVYATAIADPAARVEDSDRSNNALDAQFAFEAEG